MVINTSFLKKTEAQTLIYFYIFKSVRKIYIIPKHYFIFSSNKKLHGNKNKDDSKCIAFKYHIIILLFKFNDLTEKKKSNINSKFNNNNNNNNN